MANVDLMAIDCEIRVRVPGSRVRRVLQPMGEVSLQTGCRYSHEQSATQFMIVVCSGQEPASRVPA
jgi:hypothetical protein